MSDFSGADNDASGSYAVLPEITSPQSLDLRVEQAELAQFSVRIREASDELESCLQSIVKMQADCLSEERNCKDLDAELDDWQTLMDELESVVEWLGAGHRSGIAPKMEGYKEPAIKSLLPGNSSKPQPTEEPADNQHQIRELANQLKSIQSEQSTDTSITDAPYVNRIILLSNGHENFKFPLTRSIMTIGRAARADICIPSRFISRFHVRIVSDEQGSIIEDLESSNGVKVNSQRVKRKQLRSGDLVDLGRTQLKFIDLMEDTSGEGSA